MSFDFKSQNLLITLSEDLLYNVYLLKRREKSVKKPQYKITATKWTIDGTINIKF